MNSRPPQIALVRAKYIFFGFIIASLAASLIGCATIPSASTDLLKFLVPGKTTRQDVLFTLGQPSATFEQEKVFTYRIGQDNNDAYYVVGRNQPQSWQAIRYSLVLIFDSDGILRKQNLVPVR